MSPDIYDLKDFLEFEPITNNWEVIRNEYESLNAPLLDIDRVNKSHGQVYEELLAQKNGNGWLQGWNTDGQPNPKWLTYGIRIYDTLVLDVEEKMPETSKLISALSGVRVCALNKMLPDLFLGTHRHEDHKKRGTLLYHLCLSMNDDEQSYNYLNVNGTFIHQTPGAAYVFDGSLDHFALNASPNERIIMYVEFYPEKLSKR